MSYGGYYGPSNENRGPNLRIIGAIIIAVIGIAIYSFQTQVNPVTGKTQHIAMSPSEEKALGLQAAPEMAAKMGGDDRPVPRPAGAPRPGRRPAARRAERRQPERLRRQLPLLLAERSRDDQRLRPPRAARFSLRSACSRR